MKLVHGRRATNTLLVFAVGFGCLFISVPNAQAVGYNSWFCDSGNQFYSGSSQLVPSTTQDNTNNGCGTMGAASRYSAYPGSPVYQTGMTYHSTYAISPNPGNVTNEGGVHYASAYGIWAASTNYT